MAKRKAVDTRTPTMRETIVSALLKQIEDGGSPGVSAAKVLSELEGFFDSRNDPVTEATAKRLCDLAERIERNKGDGPHAELCPCPRCEQTRFDRRLRDSQEFQPRVKVDLKETTMLKGNEI